MSENNNAQLVPAHNYSPQSTDEQVTIYNWVENGEGHAVIKARAGAGKTTTLVEICNLLPPEANITFLAFNVHIKKELQARLPKNVFCYTTHGLGYSAIMRKYKDMQVDDFKVDKVITKLSKNWRMDGIENKLEYMMNMKKLIGHLRLSLTLNKKYAPDVCEKHEIAFDGEDIDRTYSVLEAMLNDKKTIDFIDMVYLPNVDPKIWLFPQDYVLVDEAQDLSRAQHEMIKKCVKKDKSGKFVGRMIFVGDDMQAIYGFAGADSFSFNNLSKIPNTLVFPLTTTFRCAKNIVLEANKIVKDIKPTHYAADGIVRNGNVLIEAEDGDFVLSRKTFPLVKLFFELLVDNKKAYIKGSDIGESLIDFTKDHTTTSQLDASLTNKLAEYREKLRKHGVLKYSEDNGYVALSDKVKILRFMMQMVNDVDSLKKRIQYIFREDDREGIVLSTVHKAKGLEAERVFIIMPKDLPLRTSQPWQYQQEMNLKYIAITRAKNELVYDLEWDTKDGTFQELNDDE